MSYLLNALLENLSEIGFSTDSLNNQLENYEFCLQEEDYSGYQSSLEYVKGIKASSICYPLTVETILYMGKEEKANAYLAKLVGSNPTTIKFLRSIRVSFQDNWIALLEEQLGGSRGKAVRKALLNCQSKDVFGWAMSLWKSSSPDELQTLFKLEEVIKLPLVITKRRMNCQFDSLIEFLGMKKFISMLSKTTFKIEDKEHQITLQMLEDCKSILDRSMEFWPEQFLGLEKPRIKNFHELHEFLWKQEVKFEPSYSLYCQEIALPLDGLIVGEFQLEIPWTSKTLKEWGKKLSHCVGGYGSAINNGDSVIVGVNKDSEPIYTIELINNFYDTSWQIKQFFGYKNILAPKEIQETISRAILNIVNI